MPEITYWFSGWGKKSLCRYVAEIVSMEDDTYEVACMKKQDSKGLIYSFPEKRR